MCSNDVMNITLLCPHREYDILLNYAIHIFAKKWGLWIHFIKDFEKGF